MEKTLIHNNQITNEKKNKKQGKRRFRNYFKKNYTKVKNKITKENIISKDKSEKENQAVKKVRNPGVDIIRIISMYNIIIFHYINFGKPFRRFPKYTRELWLLFCFINWHNDAFILISGIIGYKTNKYSNLLYLWLVVLFYSVAMHKYVYYYKKNYLIKYAMFKEYYPVVFKGYWYFTSYFGMYLFLPVINKGIASLSKYEFNLIILSTLGIFSFWKYYNNPSEDIFFLADGRSITWFLALYLMGAYIGKYQVNYLGIKKYIYCFICLLLFIISSYLYFKASINEFFLNIGNKRIQLPKVFKNIINGRFDSLVKTIQSITVCLFCMQLNYNKYIAKIICFCGPLIFQIYLIHHHKLIIPTVLARVFDKHSTFPSYNDLLSFLLIRSFKTFIICIFIDYLRHLLFSLLRIRKLLIFLENKMKEKFS